MSLLMATLKIEYGTPGNPLYNMFGYKSNLVVADEINQFLIAMEAQLVPKVMAVVVATAQATQIEVIDTGNPANFGSVSFAPGAHVGGPGGDQMPVFVAWKYQLVRSVRGKRSGWKRFGPISESMVTNGEYNNVNIADITALATQLHAPLKIGIIDTWFPVVLERPRGLVTTYNFHDFSTALFKGVTTQNTRKR